jgi:hypothetical protein
MPRWRAENRVENRVENRTATRPDPTVDAVLGSPAVSMRRGGCLAGLAPDPMV